MGWAPEAPEGSGNSLSLVLCCFRKAARQLESRKVWKHRDQLFGEPTTSERCGRDRGCRQCEAVMDTQGVGLRAAVS